MTKKTQKVEKVVAEKIEKVEKKIERFCFRFISSVSIGGKIFSKDTLINLTEEELKEFRPYVVCNDAFPIQKQPCKRC